VQRERVRVRHLGDDKRDTVRHQTRNEMHVARQSVELCDGDLACLAMSARLGQRDGEFRAAVERVASLARCVLFELSDDLEARAMGKSGEGGALGVYPAPGSTPLASAYILHEDR